MRARLDRCKQKGFDAVEFDGIEELSDEFSRVRGLLGLIQWPHNYHFRTFLLAEIDRLISNKEELELSNNQTNTFVRLGYQIGTPRDEKGRDGGIESDTADILGLLVYWLVVFGALIGARYGEAFVTKQPPRVDDLVAAYGGHEV